MEEKLKTLNDLKSFEIKFKGEGDDLVCLICIDKTELEQEAIKWIKEIRNNLDNPPICLDKPEQTIDWIKYFFGISKEDLKDGKQ